jgi:secreted PhoX family phosphatase
MHPSIEAHDPLQPRRGAWYAADNLCVHPRSGDLFVGEDADDLQLVLLASGSPRVAAPFVQLVGHGNGESGSPGQDDDNVPSSSWSQTSEVTGLAFSPDGTRLYLSSQRGRDGVNGMTFEITGPFRP